MARRAVGARVASGVVFAALGVACARPSAQVEPEPARAASEGAGEAVREDLREPASTIAASSQTVVAGPERAADPSCDGRPGAGDDCNGESCCTRRDVPAGTFDMPRDNGSIARKVAVRAFAMDKYEATVGRFRAWTEAGRPLPADWPATLVVQDARAMEGWKRYDTWTGGDDRRPKNFVTWATALAFCRFAGGRLPTDAEWKYAALGGDEQRAYPWGAEAPSATRAVYNCSGDGRPGCKLADILPVGSRPAGAGRWGHADLAGSMFEWTDDQGSRGGGFCFIGGVDRRATTELRPTVRRDDDPTTTSHMVGVRCAFDRE